MGFPNTGLADLAPLSSLANPTRCRLYAVVVERGRPVGRDEAADAVGISRGLAAYHLDKLAKDGLIEIEYARPLGRGGRGAGRPAKLYRRAAREFVLRAPPRDYLLLAELLLRVVAGDEGRATQAAVEHAAAALGERLGATGGSVEAVLRDRGYEPAMAEIGLLRLRNCPFAAVAARCPDVVCALNLALIRGILSGSGADPEMATLAPRQGGCCVEISAA